MSDEKVKVQCAVADETNERDTIHETQIQRRNRKNKPGAAAAHPLHQHARRGT